MFLHPCTRLDGPPEHIAQCAAIAMNVSSLMMAASVRPIYFTHPMPFIKHLIRPKRSDSKFHADIANLIVERQSDKESNS